MAPIPCSAAGENVMWSRRERTNAVMASRRATSESNPASDRQPHRHGLGDLRMRQEETTPETGRAGRVVLAEPPAPVPRPIWCRT